MSAFLDSNVVLYALGNDEPKRRRARQLLDSGPTISTQVVNECSHLLRRKAGWSPAQIATELTLILALTPLVEVGMADVRTAWSLAGRYGFSHFDSLILASALACGCSTLYSEDLQDGQVIEDRLTVRNPFLEVGTS